MGFVTPPSEDDEDRKKVLGDGRLYMITWQDEYDYWMGVGPMQVIFRGVSTEKEALSMIKSSAAKEWEFLGKCGKYKVYKADQYNSYDENTIKNAQKKGFNWCFF